MADLFGAIAGELVHQVELRSNVTPDVVVEPGQLAQAPSRLGPLLQPTLTIRDSRGRQLVHLAPYGEPGQFGALVAAGVVLGLVAVGFVLGRYLR